jgi:hypothetical protein
MRPATGICCANRNAIACAGIMKPDDQIGALARIFHDLTEFQLRTHSGRSELVIALVFGPLRLDFPWSGRSAPYPRG